MQTQIKLTETPNDNIKNVLLYLDSEASPKVIGRLDSSTKTFFTKRKLNQIYRKTNSIAFNFEFITKNDIDVVRVELEDNLLFITKNFLLNKGVVYRHKGYDLQIFCNINEFSKSEESAKQREFNVLEVHQIDLSFDGGDNANA